MRQVVVIGAGISGLVCALRLSAMSDVQVTLLERDDHLGGKIATRRHEGSVIEGGPDGFIAWRPQGLALCKELGIDVVRSTPGRSAIIRAGRPNAIPAGIAGTLPTSVMPTLRSPLIGLRAKARLLTEGARRRRREDTDESVASFVARRAGRDVWDRIVEPLITGMYAANGELLSAQATTPLLVAAEREHGSLTRAALAARRRARRSPDPKRTTGGAPVFCTTADGMGGIVHAIEARLAGVADVRTGATVTAVERTPDGWAVQLADEVIAADSVVIAAPAFAAAELLRGVDPALGDELAAIPFADTSVVAFVFPAGAVPPTAGLGYVVPASEGTPVVACSVASSKFPDLVGGDHQVVRVYVGRHGDGSQLLSDDETAAIAERHLAGTLGIHVPPMWRTVVRMPAAFPQYVVGHRDRVARIEALASRHPGLILTGASYTGIGIPDCIGAGWASADRAAEGLGTLDV